MNSAVTNPHADPAENGAPLLKRLYIYQRERFPLVAHGLLIAAFTFSAISYSRISRGEPGFIGIPTYLCGFVITFTLFLLLRILDEFKDADDDARYRSHLPVPRGVVRLGELKNIGIGIVTLQLAVNVLCFPAMLTFYLLVAGYLFLMTREFFVPEWLRGHQFWYVTSHMLIIPLVDVYASGLDWFLEGSEAPTGLLFFFLVSFLNGIVLETGRKIRVPADERPGVLTYSSMLGPRKATWLFLAMLASTLLAAIAAARYAGYGKVVFAVLLATFVACALPALLFIRNMETRRAKQIEKASGLWTIAMYATLGLMPMLHQLLIDG